MNKDVKIIQKMKVKVTGKMILMKSKCSSGMREYTFVYHDMNEVSKQICVKKTWCCVEGNFLEEEREGERGETKEREKKEEERKRGNNHPFL